MNPFPKPSGQDDGSDYDPNIEIGKVCSFSWEIKRGQSFQKKITEGLVFCIESSNFGVENGGWEINIGDEFGEECNDNFAGVVTPPFHGNNAIFVQGWEFRNETNTANSKGNALRRRYFNFVFNQSSYEAAFNLLYPDPASTNPKTDLTEIPRSRGVFTITELKLGNLIPNKVAWIEFMKFEVKIYLQSN